MGLMVLVAALLMGTAAAEEATVTANVDSVVSIVAGEAPVGAAGMLLDPTSSPEEVADDMLIKSTANWQVQVSDEDTTNTAGKMTKYDTSTSTYTTGTKLATGMVLTHLNGGTAGSGSASALPTDGSENQLVTGTATGDAGTDVDFKYVQESSFADARLTGANEIYRIVITFAASTTG